MRRFMIDIESLGEQPGGVILSIAWCEFTRERIVSAHERRIDVESCFDAGLKCSPIVIEFWLNQPGKPWTDGRDSLCLYDALVDLNNDLIVADEVWAKPPSYDLIAIRHAMKLVGIDASWSHRSEMCLRTLLRFHPQESNNQNQHIAYYDAIAQATQAQDAMREMKAEL
jgi:3' exoribonuclease, RNase T-like